MGARITLHTELFPSLQSSEGGFFRRCRQKGRRNTGAKGGQRPLPSKSGCKGGKSAFLVLSTNTVFSHFTAYIRSSLRLDHFLTSGIHDLPRNATVVESICLLKVPFSSGSFKGGDAPGPTLLITLTGPRT